MEYIKENQVFYAYGEHYWVDIVAINNFQEKIINLIEIEDVLKIDNEKYEVIYDESYEKLGILIPDRKQLAVRHSSVEFIFQKYQNIEILTHEQYSTNCYKVGG